MGLSTLLRCTATPCRSRAGAAQPTAVVASSKQRGREQECEQQQQQQQHPHNTPDASPSCDAISSCGAESKGTILTDSPTGSPCDDSDNLATRPSSATCSSPSEASSISEAPLSDSGSRGGRGGEKAARRRWRAATFAILATRRLARAASAGADADAPRSEEVHLLMRSMQHGQPLGGFSQFATEYIDEAFCRRLLAKCDGNVSQCIAKLRKTLAWRERNRDLLTTKKFVHATDNRVLGVDLSRRPVLYLCLKNQFLPLAQNVQQFVFASLQAIDNMPRGVETATHIWDLHGMMMHLNWNPAPLMAIVEAMEGHFVGRLHTMILVEMPRVAKFLKDAAWAFLPQKTKQKIKFMSVEEVTEHLHRECDSEVSERITAAMAQNRDASLTLEERKRTWMRVDAQGALVPAFL